MRASGLPFAVCLFFARNPDESMTAKDIAAKFDQDPQFVNNTLKSVVRRGYLKKERGNESDGRILFYSAGPNL